MNDEGSYPYDSFTIKIKTWGPCCPHCGFIDCSSTRIETGDGAMVCKKCGEIFTPKEAS